MHRFLFKRKGAKAQREKEKTSSSSSCSSSSLRLYAFAFKKILFLLPLLLSSCQKELVSITHRSLTVERYASYHVNTPDPLLEHPVLGEELHIHWDKTLFTHHRQIEIVLSLRYGDLTDEVLNYPITSNNQRILFQLVGEAYLLKKGILSYKVEIYGDGALLDVVHHQLWAEIIKIREP